VLHCTVVFYGTAAYNQPMTDPTDLLERLDGLRQDHPEVEITAPVRGMTSRWVACWEPTSHTAVIVTSYELGAFLDELEERLYQGAPAPVSSS